MKESNILEITTNSRARYFSEMKMFTVRVQSLISQYVNSHCKDDKLLPTVKFFLNKRSQKDCLLKPFLAKLSYDVLGGRNIDKILPIAAVAEFINTSSYQANSVLDGKYGILSKEDKDNQLIASMITREIADLVIDHTPLNDDLKDRLKFLYSEANGFMYYGQFYELNVLHISNLNFEAIDLNDYLKLYLTKCNYISGIFSKNVALSGAILVTSEQTSLTALGNYALNFGIGLNIINDMSDYLPLANQDALPSYKTPIDQYSDIRNGRIFLPVFYALKFGDKEQRTYIVELLNNEMEYTDEKLRRFTDILLATKAIQYTFLTAKKYMKEAKKYLHQLQKSNERDLLSIMASVIRTNKFMNTFNRLK
jgi:geranylgeranyl pyrophosphate synthase